MKLEGDMKILFKLRLHARNSVEEKALLSLLAIAPNSLKNVLLTSARSGKNVVMNTDHSSVFLNNRDAFILLERLGLNMYYPGGLHAEDSLRIELEPLQMSLANKSLTSSKQLSSLVLHKLMACDIQCRSDLMPVVEEDEWPSEHASESDCDSNSSFTTCNISFSGAESSFNTCSSIVDNSGIHPMDCLLSLIICSDNFLRQDLFSRLAKCQLAVPFILPDPFTKKLTIPLWCLRTIIKEWECTGGKNEKVQKKQPIISYGMPIVSFIRLGKYNEHVRSKSKLLSEVISDSHYDHFFHRDCPGGDYKLVLGEGLVDMCWYLPGKTTSAFPDAVTFLNLHGDVREHPQQTKFLSQISTMCFVLLTEEKLQLDDNTAKILERFSSSVGGITVLSSIKSIPKALEKKATTIKLGKNAFRIKETIRSQISKKFQCIKTFQSIDELCDQQETIAILTDEQGRLYREGLARAAEVTKLITTQQELRIKTTVKNDLLPLQGETLWKAWAANNKELFRQNQRGNKTVNVYSSSIRKVKATIREQQMKHIDTLTPTMETFIVSLLQLRGYSNRILRNYFLQCLKQELNNLSRESISGLQYQYQSVQKELLALEKKMNNAQHIERLKKKLEYLQETIINSSFGLEHLLRELGQVYEAALESGFYGAHLCSLPQAAAELLIDGYPLELMDGDAAHVPLQWVTAVLKEATEMLHDPNIFVLSVLGLQSTGKSTMLNTVFGVQFNVSAGRCTRGAFMQLLPLGKELGLQANCSYVLLVDTGGLRASELDPIKTQNHDNEFATFVIGLANMTLINIYGEIPGDMNDILQTSVHAFLTMSRIKFSLSCQFVHQNAGASVNSEVVRANFTEKLNQVTKEAARQENCEAEFACFNDVIKFNDQTDIHYFPGLWSGAPPMAPIDRGYSHSAQLLKHHIINKLCQKSTHSSSGETAYAIHLSAFIVKVQDLWKALLHENFVFCFKNTQEITAYQSLEAEYSKWDWEVREAMLKWEQVAENEISATEARNASKLADQKCKELARHMSTLHEPIQTKMETFFSGKQSEILIQWKAKFQIRFKNLIEELRLHAKSHCEKLGRMATGICEFEERKKSYATQVTVQVQGYIASIKRERQELYESLELGTGTLTSTQLEQILRMKLFTRESLKSYKEQGIINGIQLNDTQTIIDGCNNALTKDSLHEIFLRGILTLEHLKQILTKGRQPEQELETKFNEIWIDLIAQVPPVSVRTTSVESDVENVLFKFACTQGYEGHLIAELQKKSLRDWGSRLELYPTKTIHYNEVGFVRKAVSYLFNLRGKTESRLDPYLIAALEMTEKVFEKAKNCLKCITEKKTDFKSVYALELLRAVVIAIEEESKAVEVCITITNEYKRTMFKIVCGYAIPQFEEMAASFTAQTDPILYLETHIKTPLFTTFKNQYYS